MKINKLLNCLMAVVMSITNVLAPIATSVLGRAAAGGAATLAVAALPTAAHAQEGSRVCGYIKQSYILQRNGVKAATIYFFEYDKVLGLFTGGCDSWLKTYAPGYPQYFGTGIAARIIQLLWGTALGNKSNTFWNGATCEQFTKEAAFNHYGGDICNYTVRSGGTYKLDWYADGNSFLSGPY